MRAFTTVASVTFGNSAEKVTEVIAAARAMEQSLQSGPRRSSPIVVQTLATVDASERSVLLSMALAARYGRTPTFDWLLRLDLASNPPRHEQWHGQAHGIGGRLDLTVQPSQWPKTSERWFLRLWLRDPSGNADWNLVETRALP